MTNLKNYFSMHSNEFMLIFGSSRIGYDPVKEIKNRRKHHYSLQSAVHLLEKTIFPCGNDLRITIKQCVIKEEVRYNIMAFDDDKNIVLMGGFKFEVQHHCLTA